MFHITKSAPPRRGWQIASEYVDRMSGKYEHRPELDRLWGDCRKRKVDAVVVYRYDRFARSLRQLVNALEEFRGLGIEFVSLHEGVDTSTPNGRLVFGIFASIAEFERELIRDRVRSGLASARAKGKRLGRPTVTVDTARITALRASGRTWTSIAQELGVGEGTVRRAAAAKNLLQIALASALVPVLEPGHFDPPQIFVSGGAHFAEQGRYSAQTPDRAIRLPGPVPSAFSGF